MEYRYQLAHDKYKILYIQFLVIYFSIYLLGWETLVIYRCFNWVDSWYSSRFTWFTTLSF